MKQKFFIGSIMIIMYILLLTPNPVTFAASDYTIQSYDINMVVNENNTFDITENITAYFKVARHGIYRKIPFKNSVKRLDGTTSNNTAKITDIRVNEKYTISNEKGYKVIKIGNANSTLTGKQNYTISYQYQIGKDPLKNADELYFNLIGEEWDTSIDKVSFTITMPKAFDPSLLGFSSGKVGSTNSSNVVYQVEQNRIRGNTIDPLKKGEALTIRLTLPEGYFSKASTNIDLFSVFVIILCVVFILIAVRLWKTYGKEEPVVETVEFYPPKNYNSAEIEFLYQGFVDERGIISLLVYLANQGYLTIKEIEKKENLPSQELLK